MFNPNDDFNILIGWRSPSFFDTEWKSQRNYLWLHDIQNPNEYTPARVDRLDKIMALSQWHRDNMPNVDDAKFMLTSNGINVMDFTLLDKEGIKRNPHAVFYGSSYDRGLEHLLKIWPEVKQEVPDAELHICYGWNLFESFYHNNPERMAWKAKLDEMMKADGIVHHGRIGQVDVLRLQYMCGIWAYPTHFGEINCITAIKSQAAGCIPVVCDYAALQQTVQFGKKLAVESGEDIYDPDKKADFKQLLVDSLTDTKWQEDVRPDMMKWARETYGWDKIAGDWDAEFKTSHLKEAGDTLLKEHPEMEKYLPVKLQEEYGKEQTY
jgi:glycosyltransferase involved in cell wall biosynthesis